MKVAERSLFLETTVSRGKSYSEMNILAISLHDGLGRDEIQIR